jgi:hypothetical protein
MPKRIQIKRQQFISLRSKLPKRLILRQSRLFFREAHEEALKQGAGEIGAAFLRFATVRDSTEVEADFGFFLNRPLRANGPFQTGAMPAADYLAATWQGNYDRMRDVHSLVLQWANFSKLTIDSSRDENGLHFGCLLNVFRICDLTEPDPLRWETDILFRLKKAEPGKAEEPFLDALPPPLSARPE